MNRIPGILLSLFGILVTLLGLATTRVALAEKRAEGNFVAFFLVMTAVGILIVFLGVRSFRRAGKSLAAPEPERDADGSSLSERDDEKSLLPDVLDRRQYDGKEYLVLYQSAVTGKESRPASLSVAASAWFPTTLQFQRETWFDRVGKRLGIAREHQTEDFVFNEAVYIRGPSESYAERYLADTQKRSAICELLDAGFTEVHLRGEAVAAIWPSFDPAKNDRPGLAEDAGRSVLALASNLPDAEDSDEFRKADGRDWGSLWFYPTVVAGAAVAVITLSCPPVRYAPILWPSFYAFVIAYPVLAFVSGVLLHGRSTSHDNWAKLVGYNWAAVAAACFVAVATLNALGDTSRPTERILTVTNKKEYTGRWLRKSYYVLVPAWDGQGGPVELSVSSSEYERILPGRAKIKLVTSPGLLNIEWIKSQEVQQ